MSDAPNIDEQLLQRLRQRAQNQGVSVNKLLADFLAPDTSAQQTSYAYLDATPSAITVVDVSQPHQPTIYVNRAFEQQTGYAAAEVIGRNLNFLQGDDRDQPGRTTMREAIQQEQSCTVVLRNYRKDGSMFWNEIRLAPLANEQGQVTRYIGIQNDVTERIQTERVLRDNERTLAMALRAAHAAVWVWDIASDRVTWDADMEAMHGLKPGTFGGDYSAWRAAVHPDDLPGAEDSIQAALAGVTSFNEEFRVVWPDGTVHHILGQAVVIRNEVDGQPLQMVGVNSDITERKQAEQTLAHNEQQLRWLIQNMPVLVDAFNPEKHIIVWNHECERVTGYRADEIVENPRSVELLYPDPDYRQYVIDDALQFGDELYNREYTLTCKDGSKRTIRWSHIPAPYSVAGGTTWAIGIDVTEQHRAERALRASEEKYRLLVEHSHQGMVIAQANPTRLRFASQPMQAITGHTPNELTRFTPDQLVQLVHPEDQERFFNTFRARLAGEVMGASARYRLIHKSGDTRHVDLYSSRIDYEGEPATQTVFLDVSEQVETERLKIRFQKEQEQNALVQRVVSMLSHDLRTPLAVIASSRDILHRHFDRLSDEKREEKLDSIGRQVRFATELLEDAVNTVRGPINTREFIPQSVNLAMLCQISVDEVREARDGDHDMQFINKGSVETVSVDEVLVSRILINLLSNAIKYSPAGSKIRLELDQSEEWVILRVSDQGMGISQEDLSHIFDPFYRADKVHHINGTGLGLNIVRDCVDRHQGRIHVESKLGQGSTFTVELPMQVDS